MGIAPTQLRYYINDSRWHFGASLCGKPFPRNFALQNHSRPPSAFCLQFWLVSLHCPSKFVVFLTYTLYRASFGWLHLVRSPMRNHETSKSRNVAWNWCPKKNNRINMRERHSNWKDIGVHTDLQENSWIPEFWKPAKLEQKTKTHTHKDLHNFRKHPKPILLTNKSPKLPGRESWSEMNLRAWDPIIMPMHGWSSGTWSIPAKWRLCEMWRRCWHEDHVQANHRSSRQKRWRKFHQKPGCPFGVWYT